MLYYHMNTITAPQARPQNTSSQLKNDPGQII